MRHNGWEYANPNCCLPYDHSNRTGEVFCPRALERIRMSKFDAKDPGASCAGRTIYEIGLDEVGDVMAEIYEAAEAEAGGEVIEALKAKANGMTKILAILQNPYYPNMDAVKHDAVERFEARP